MTTTTLRTHPGATGRPAGRSRRPGAQGFVLLEVLVALLIFAFGVLGLVGLQAAMTKAQTSSKLRTEAAYLAQEFLGTMWADIGNLPSYSDAGCTGNPRCNAILGKVKSTLPAGAVAFDTAAVVDGTIGLTITWTPPGEDTRTYQTATQIRR